MDLNRAAYAIGTVESNNDYSALGPVIRNGGAYNGDRAYGRYQVMGRNIPSWTEQALGRRMTPEEFLRDQAAQDAVFAYHFGRNMASRGFEDAASIWHSGRPLDEAARRGANDGYIDTTEYVRRAAGHLGAEPTAMGNVLSFGSAVSQPQTNALGSIPVGGFGFGYDMGAPLVDPLGLAPQTDDENERESPFQYSNRIDPEAFRVERRNVLAPAYRRYA